MNKKELISTAKELNTALGLNPPIDVKGSEEELKSLILEAEEMIEPADKISEASEKVINELKEADEEADDVEIDEEDEDDDDFDEDYEEDDDDFEEEEEVKKPAKKETKKPAKKETKKVAPINEKEVKEKVIIKSKTTMPGKPSQASIVDKYLVKGATLKEIVDNVQKDMVKFEYDPKQYTGSRIRSHAKYRIDRGQLIDVKMRDLQDEK